MWVNSAISLARLLALLALLSQALMPGAMAAAMSRPGDVPAFVCAMPGQDEDKGASALGAELASLLADKAAGDAPALDHDCHDCVLGQTAALPDVASLAAPALYAEAADVFPRAEPRFWTVPRGPPLGSRAPPELMKA
ncbi:MAG: hypothetical protein RLO80_11040 [Hyphomonas sp.]